MENLVIFKPALSTTHSPINCHFSKNSSDFVVRENPLYEFSSSGEHLILEIQKKGLTTIEALGILSKISGVKMRDFGYAGLKDKEGMTTQFISLPAKFQSKIQNLENENLKILSATKHNNKIKIGHLKSNNFFIRLKKVLPLDATKLENALKLIDKNGYPNYFGFQRFGKFQDNALQGENILNSLLSGDKAAFKKFNPKLKNLLISAFQSELFNKWLSKRVEISRFSDEFSIKELEKIYGFSKETLKELKSQKQFFKLFKGDVLGHYPFGKVFLCENPKDEIGKFILRDRTICGPIYGGKCFKSADIAEEIENPIFKDLDKYRQLMTGSRRFAWCWVENLSYKYLPEVAQFSLSFTLQKGSYATVFLREILGKEILA